VFKQSLSASSLHCAPCLLQSSVMRRLHCAISADLSLMDFRQRTTYSSYWDHLLELMGLSILADGVVHSGLPGLSPRCDEVVYLQERA